MRDDDRGHPEKGHTSIIYAPKWENYRRSLGLHCTRTIIFERWSEAELSRPSNDGNVNWQTDVTDLGEERPSLLFIAGLLTCGEPIFGGGEITLLDKFRVVIS